MNFARTLILAGAALVLGLYVYTVEIPQLGVEPPPDRVLEFDAHRVAEMRMLFAETDDLTLVQDGSGWRMVEPVEYPADQIGIERMLDTIAGAQPVRRLPADAARDLNDYGLAGNGSHVRIEMKLDDGSELPAIVVGDTTPVDFEAFVRVDGQEEIIITPLLFHSGVKKTPTDLRDKRMLRLTPDQVSAVTLQTPSHVLVLEREGDEWVIREPVQDFADPDRMRSLLATLGTIDAVDFFDDTHAAERREFGLTTPIVTVEATVNDQRTGFRVGKLHEENPTGHYFERMSDGQIAKVPENILRKFAFEVDQLRDLRMFRCDFEEVRRVDILRPGSAFALLRDSADSPWTLSPATGNELNQEAVQDTIEKLQGMKAESIIAEGVLQSEGLAIQGLDAPAITVRLSTAQASCGGLQATPPPVGSEETEHYFRRLGEGTVLVAQEHVYSRVDLTPELLGAPPKGAPRKAGKPPRAEREQLL